MQHPIAVIADIHGNAPALEAVLRHARSRGAGLVANLGDLFFGPLCPARTLELLRCVDFAPLVTVIGNQDRLLMAPPVNGPANPNLEHTLAELGATGIDYLRTMHSLEVIQAEGDEILLCHGSPVSDTDYLLEDVSRGVPMPRDPDEVCEAVQRAPYTVVCCGHTHIPRVAVCADSLIVNPGSVGLQAYTCDTPSHAMQTGSPHARYALLHRDGEDWTVERVLLPYDWSEAAETARANGRDDWAAWLATGRADVPGA